MLWEIRSGILSVMEYDRMEVKNEKKGNLGNKGFFFFLFYLCSNQSLKGVIICVEQIDLCILL